MKYDRLVVLVHVGDQIALSEQSESNGLLNWFVTERKGTEEKRKTEALMADGWEFVDEHPKDELHFQRPSRSVPELGEFDDLRTTPQQIEQNIVEVQNEILMYEGLEKDYRDKGNLHEAERCVALAEQKRALLKSLRSGLGGAPE